VPIRKHSTKSAGVELEELIDDGGSELRRDLFDDPRSRRSLTNDLVKQLALYLQKGWLVPRGALCNSWIGKTAGLGLLHEKLA
jgi:hypothetical protein